MAALLAYLDPGSGSLILQVVLGLIAASWVFLKAQGDRVRGWFRGDRGPAVSADAEESPKAGDAPPTRGASREG